MNIDEIKAQMKAWENAHEIRQKQFWSDVYPKMSLEDKIIYWRKDVFNAMQFREEQGEDPYLAFNQDWLEYHRSVEPEFDKILPEIVKKLSLNDSKVKAAIKK